MLIFLEVGLKADNDYKVYLRNLTHSYRDILCQTSYIVHMLFGHFVLLKYNSLVFV